MPSVVLMSKITLAVRGASDYAHIAKTVDDDHVVAWCGREGVYPNQFTADTLQEAIDFDAWHICAACQVEFKKENP